MDLVVVQQPGDAGDLGTGAASVVNTSPCRSSSAEPFLREADKCLETSTPPAPETQF